MLNLGCGQYLRNPFFSRILGSKVGVRVLYSCGLYSAVYGIELSGVNNFVYLILTKCSRLQALRSFAQILLKSCFHGFY